MKHIPVIMLVICFLVVLGFSAYFCYNLFGTGRATIASGPVKKAATPQTQQKQPDHGDKTNVISGYEMWEKALKVDFNPEIENIDRLLQEKNKLHNSDPQNKEVIYEVAYYSFLKGYNAQAKNYYDQLIQLDNNDKSAQLAKAYLLYTLKSPNKAMAIIDNLIKNNADDAQLYLCKAILLENIKDNDNARKNYLKVLQLDRSNKRAKTALVKLGHQ